MRDPLYMGLRLGAPIILQDSLAPMNDQMTIGPAEAVASVEIEQPQRGQDDHDRGGADHQYIANAVSRDALARLGGGANHRGFRGALVRACRHGSIPSLQEGNLSGRQWFPPPELRPVVFRLFQALIRSQASS